MAYERIESVLKQVSFDVKLAGVVNIWRARTKILKDRSVKTLARPALQTIESMPEIYEDIVSGGFLYFVI